MARYIDAEKLCKALRDMAFYQNPYKQSTILGVVESIENFPAADVAPKSEVEELSGRYEDLKLKHSDLQKDKDELFAWVNDKKSEIAREIFDEIEKNTFGFGYAVMGDMSVTTSRRIDERCLVGLKKKYLEEK